MNFDDRSIIVGITMIMVVYSVYRADRYKEIKELLTPIWIVNFILMILFGSFLEWYTGEDPLVQESLKKGMLAFIIALLAHLRMTIAPFWIVFVLSYYMSGWV